MARRFETLTAGQNDSGRRIDVVLRRALANLPLSVIYRALRDGRVRVSGKRVKPGSRVQPGSEIEVESRLFEAGRNGGKGGTAQPAAAAADAPEQRSPRAGRKDPDVRQMILLETPHLLALNKPAGIAVQGGADRRNRPLDELVRAYLSSRTESSLSFRPGPLHRLDRNTTGILLFSVSLEGARRFSDALRGGRVRKYYLALLEGELSEAERWTDPLVRDDARRKTWTADAAEGPAAGRRAETRVIPLFTSSDRTRTLILCRLVTGRAHQIRAHAAAHGHPLAGDRKYGAGTPLPAAPASTVSPGREADSYLLHAFRLEIEPPDPLLGAIELEAAPSARQLQALTSTLQLQPGDLEAATEAAIEQLRSG
ncbi:RluA family pseudouridine synthase [Salinispira pacifica]